jgi:glyoxylase-like metal-dependent hydrolase (beta-lactamase superfamily II)
MDETFGEAADMIRIWTTAFAFVCLIASGALSSRAWAQDAASVVSAASKAMGVEMLSSIHYYGVAQNGSLGQNNNADQPWPVAAANDYVRAIDFTQPASRATWTNFAVPVTGGAPVPAPGQLITTPQSNAWAQQLEIWVTPWGFLKGAAANAASVKTETIAGKQVSVVSWDAPIKSPDGQAYKLVGYINGDNLVERVQTWLDHPLFGDMLVEADYSFYRDNNGLKYPSRIEQRRGGWPTFTAYILAAFANPPTLQALLTAPAISPPPSPPPAANAPKSEKLANGVWRINGAYNALAVEFSDHVVLFEPGPQNPARAEAIIAETKRVIPGKPIRYGVISHHHFDHTGGLASVAAEGITIVTPAVNKALLESALSAPRTLAPDALAKSGKKAVIEGFTGDVRVFADRTRRFEIHVIKGLPHADGLVVGYLPKERILVYADMFNLPPAANPVPNPPVVGTKVFLENIERLKLKPERILSVHTLNPDRLTSIADIRASLGLK